MGWHISWLNEFFNQPQQLNLLGDYASNMPKRLWRITDRPRGQPQTFRNSLMDKELIYTPSGQLGVN